MSYGRSILEWTVRRRYLLDAGIWRCNRVNANQPAARMSQSNAADEDVDRNAISEVLHIAKEVAAIDGVPRRQRKLAVRIVDDALENDLSSHMGFTQPVVSMQRG